jgi:hypothetical protein
MEIDAYNPFFDAVGQPLEEGDTIALASAYDSASFVRICVLEKLILVDGPNRSRYNRLLGASVNGPQWRARVREISASGSMATRALSVADVDRMVRLPVLSDTQVTA